MKLSSKGQKWLKCLHIYSGCVWAGCATVLTIKQFFVNPENGGELYGILSTLDFIDLFILVPGAIGTFLTALVYSIWTNWGFCLYIKTVEEKKEKVNASVNQKSIGRLKYLGTPQLINGERGR